MLDRPKDWLDIEAILAATKPLDVEEIRAWLQRLGGERHSRLAHFEAVLRAPARLTVQLSRL